LELPEDCLKLLHLLAALIESLKVAGWGPDQEASDAEGFAIKIFSHGASARSLSTGTPVPGLFGSSDAVIYDVGSMMAVAPACLEAYVNLHHIFLAPADADVRHFRHLAWELAGVGQRAKYESTFEQLQEQTKRDIAAAENISSDLQQTVTFQNLPDGQKKA